MKNLRLLLILFLGAAIFLNFAYFLDICDFNSPQALTAQLASGDSGRSSAFDYWYIYFFILLVLLAVYFVLSDYEPRGLPGLLIGLLVLICLPFVYLLNRFFGAKIYFFRPAEERPPEAPAAPPAGGPAVPEMPSPEILPPAEVYPEPGREASPELGILPQVEAAAPARLPARQAGSSAFDKFKIFLSANKKPIFIAAVSVAVLILAAGGILIFTGKPVMPPTAAPSPSPIALISPTFTPSPAAPPAGGLTPALSPTITPLPSPTRTPAPTPSPTSTPTSIPSPTPIPTFSPTPTPTPVSTPTPAPSPILTPLPTETIFPSPSPEFTPTSTFIALASPTPAPSPTLTPASSPIAAATPAVPTPGLPSFMRPGEELYVAPPKTSLEIFFEKLIPYQYRFTAFIAVIFILIPLLYLSPIIFLIKSGIGHVLFLIEKMRTTAGVSPPAPVYAKLTVTPLRIISSILIIFLLVLLIFIPPFSTQTRAVISKISGVFKAEPVSTPSPAAPPAGGLTPSPTPTPTPILTPTPVISPSPAPTATVTPVAIISPTPLATPVPSPTLTPTPSPAAPPAGGLTPTPTAIAIFSPTPLPTPVSTPTPTPLATIALFASPTPSPTPAVAATESPPIIETPPPPSIFAPVKEFYRRAVLPEYRWLLYLLAAMWFAILALLPILARLAMIRGRFGNLLKKIIAGKIGIMDLRFPVIAGNWSVAEWRTKTPSDSVVEFSVYPSSNPKYQRELAIDSELTKEHKIIMGGLKPDTTYYFKVFSTDKFGNREQSPEMSFKTGEAEKREKAQIIV